MDMHRQAWGWLTSKILSTEGCIERLAAIDNDHTNHRARDEQIERMRENVEMWRWIRDRIGEPPTDTPEACHE